MVHAVYPKEIKPLDMNKRTVFIICLLVALVPGIYLAFVWSSLPAIIPTHWGVGNKPDGWGSKNTLLGILAIPGVLGLLTSLLMLNLDKLDPKRGKHISVAVRNKLAISIMVFMTAICIYIIYVTQSQAHEMGNFIFLLIGLLFAFLGNLMYSIKQNYFVGFRLPWTLDNEENWNRSNRLMSKLFFASGVLIVISSLILPSIPVMIITFGSILISTAYTIIFSYRLFRKQQAENKLQS